MRMQEEKTKTELLDKYHDEKVKYISTLFYVLQ